MECPWQGPSSTVLRQLFFLQILILIKYLKKIFKKYKFLFQKFNNYFPARTPHSTVLAPNEKFWKKFDEKNIGFGRKRLYIPHNCNEMAFFNLLCLVGRKMIFIQSFHFFCIYRRAKANANMSNAC
jgi:hypothetical protein